MLTIDADALYAIVLHVPEEDLFPLALSHTCLRDPCLRRAKLTVRFINEYPCTFVWVTRATSSVSRVKWVVAELGGIPTRKWSWWAAEKGNLDVLKWLRTECTPPCEWSHVTCALAAREGHVDMLKWMRHVSDVPCPWDDLSCAQAARNGRLDVLKWLRDENYPPCPWNNATCSNAAANGHLEVLKWLRKESQLSVVPLRLFRRGRKWPPRGAQVVAQRERPVVQMGHMRLCARGTLWPARHSQVVTQGK